MNLSFKSYWNLLSDHISVLKDGRMESEGMLDQLLETSPEMCELWKLEENGN